MLPLLVLFLFGLVYLGQALNSYLSLTQIVRKELQSMATEATPNLMATKSYQECSAAPNAALPSEQYLLRLHQRIRDSLHSDRVDVEKNSLCILSVISPRVEQVTASSGIIKIRVSGKFPSLLPGLAALPFTVEAKSWKVS